MEDTWDMVSARLIFWSDVMLIKTSSVSTLDPKCFDNYQTAQEVVPYFEEVVALFKELNTYKALANANPPVRTLPILITYDT